jgi:DNA modification methylase
MKLTDITLNDRNPRKIDAGKLAKLKKSIQEFEKMLELRPIIVDNTGVILGGNMRFLALQQLGYTDIPDTWVKRADTLSDAEKQRFIIADNVGFGDWDWDVLQEDWDVADLSDWGLDVPEFDAEILGAEDDNFEIPDVIKTDIVLGDLFEIGEHRLLCGDSTDSDAVARLMNGQKAEMLFTSPPYSDMREYNGNKDLSVSNISDFIPTWLPFANFQVVNLGIQRKDNEIVQYWNEYIDKAKQCGLKLLSWNVWNKTISGSIASQTAMFGITHEWIFVFGAKAKDLNRTIENKHENAGKRLKKDVRQADGSILGTTSMFYSHKQLNTVIDCLHETGIIRSLHPATFPVGLPSEYIKAMTKENEIVCESFTGSGTTMVAAHQLNRKCYGMELDPQYCQVIIDRMRKLDNSIVIKKNGVVIA